MDDAFETLYDRHAAAAYGLAVRILGRTGEAEDVVQEAFLSAWRSGTYRAERGGFRPYLLTIVRHRAIDRIRRDGRLPVPVGAPDDLLERVDDRTPEVRVADRQESQLLCDALGLLPDDQAQVLELAYFGGLTQTEIADRLAQPLGTIKSRMRLGLERMRAHGAVAALAR